MDDELHDESRPHLTTSARLLLHERVCSQRWKAILARIARMENIALACAGTLIVGMAAVIMTVLLRTF